MQQLIYFIQKYKYFLYFLLLQFIALTLIFNNHNFHKSKLISSTNRISGNLYEKKTELSDYLNLKSQNTYLVEENKTLRNKLSFVKQTADTISEVTVVDSLKLKQQYTYINGKIIHSEFHKPYNFLLINRGIKDSIKKEMAIINKNGIIGVTDDVSQNYTRVKSILNKNSKINARFKKNSFYGTLKWDTKESNIVQLTDIPRQATFKIGDTIVTGGRSTIFPEGILIGCVINKPENPSAANSINVRLFNDMSNINYIYIIKNLHKQEIQKIVN